MKLPLIQNAQKKSYKEKSAPVKKGWRSSRYWQPIVFIVFVIFSATMWLLQSLRLTYSTHFTVPIEYSGWPTAFLPDHPLPKEIEVTVSDIGMNLLYYTFHKPNKIEVPFPPMAEQRHGEVVSFSRGFLSEQTRSVVLSSSKIVSLNPEEISTTIHQLHSKTVPVLPVTQVEPMQGYVAVSTKAVPDKVTLYGTAEQLERITSIETEGTLFARINKSQKTQVDLRVPTQIIARPSQVSLQVKIEELTERTLELPIRMINLPEGNQARLLPARATVKITFPISYYNQVTKLTPKLQVDYQDIVQAKQTGVDSDFLTIRIVGLPPWVAMAVISPALVQYIIEPITQRADL